METPLPVKTQGGTMNCLLTPATKYCCSVWFSSVVAKSATRTHSDSGAHESWLQEWSTPLNGAVLGVRRHSKASDAMLEHRQDPLAQRGERSRQRRAHQVTGSRCSACSGWSYERPRLHAAADRATLLEHQWRHEPCATEESAARKAPE